MRKLLNFGSRQDDVIEVEAVNRLVFGFGGDDTIIFNASDDGGRHKFIDGGRGDDALVLELTEAQWADESLRTEILALVEQIENPDHPWQKFTPVHLDALDLTIRSVEAVSVSVNGVVFDPRDPPVVNTVEDDAFSISADVFSSRGASVVVGNVLDNDSDGTVLPGDLTIVSPSNFPFGLSVLENGDVVTSTSFDTTRSNPINRLEEGETLEVSGTYITTTGDEASVTLTVVGVDDPLVVTSNGTIEVDGDSIHQAARIDITDFDDEIVDARIIDDPNTLVDDMLRFDFDTGILTLSTGTADNFGVVIEDGFVDFQLQTTNADGEIELFDLDVRVTGLGGVLPPPPPPPPPPAGLVDDFG